jgi:argininosuccinate lyase
MSQEKKASTNEALWGGRFAEGPDALMQAMNASIGVDRRLWRQDIEGSRAHVRMLAACNIIDEADTRAILEGLDTIAQELEEGRLPFRDALEDIHMHIEHRLHELIGPPAGRLHTARSRNDQVATDFRLWVREATDALTQSLLNLRQLLGQLAERHAQTVMPGYTHLQIAQPVSLGLHLQAYEQMLGRDQSRFEDGRRRHNESPLGAAALAGTPYPIDRQMTAEALGFDRPMANTMDAVSARDFATEFLFACAQCGLHLSRLAEELILWSSPGFGFITLADTWTTGSSIMPQKRNPDAAELIRAYTGRLNGRLVELMTVLKALPMTYNKDLQEDKAAVFNAYDTLALSLRAMHGMLDSMTVDRERMRTAAADGYATATRLADWLVMRLQMPFREAHRLTGAIVRQAEEQGLRLEEMPLDQLQALEPRISSDVFEALRV